MVLRRTHALLAYQEPRQDRSLIARSVPVAMGGAGGGCQGNGGERFASAALHRCVPAATKVALANPLLDFDRIVCTLEQPGDWRFAEQARASWRGHFAGGGPLVIENFKSQPRLIEPLADVMVSPATSSDAGLNAWVGKKLTGKFSGLDLSYDGRELLFAATTGSDNWRIFKFDLAARRLVQLTEGTYDDFDPCLSPLGPDRLHLNPPRRHGPLRIAARVVDLYAVLDGAGRLGYGDAEFPRDQRVAAQRESRGETGLHAVGLRGSALGHRPSLLGVFSRRPRPAEPPRQLSLALVGHARGLAAGSSMASRGFVYGRMLRPDMEIAPSRSPARPSTRRPPSGTTAVSPEAS